MELFDTLMLGTPLWMWCIFLLVVTALIAFDLGILHKKDEEVSVSSQFEVVRFLYLCWLGVWPVDLAQYGRIVRDAVLHRFSG